MATKIKDSPAFGGITEDYWPGDSEVDLDASDLERWSREGGRSGLVIADESKCAVIRWRPLTPREYDVLDAAARADAGLGIFDLAFALGFVSARNIHGVQIRTESRSGISRLTEESIRSFEQIQAKLPIAAGYDEYTSRKMGSDRYLSFVAGQLGVEQTDSAISEYRSGISIAVDGVTITRAMGVHIAIASFRG